jgi:tetratricopeptide (TPR) repeat protein
MLILVPLLASVVLAQDPIRVTASLTADRVEVGTPTTLRVVVETRGDAPDRIHLPPLPRDLDIVGTSDFSQTQISVPGGRSRATQRDYIIVARRPGVYRIPAAEVDVGRRTYRTRTLELAVSAGPAQSPGAGRRAPTFGFDDALERAPSRSRLRMWALPDTVFVGQQVLLHAEVTFGDDARGRQSRPATFDPPAPSGFWIQDVPNPVSVALRMQEGRPVETQTFRRAYFPLAAGSFAIPPARVYYEARRGFLTAETREIASDSVRLVVLPLPQQGRPDGFNGAVGRLRLSASVTPERIALGEAAVISVEVEGAGNVKALPEPQLPGLPDADVFPPTQDSRVEVVDLNVTGTKRFRWVVVPQQTGTLRIPPIEYSVFDPELRQYVVLRSDTLRLVATAAAGVEAQDTALRPLRPATASEPAGWARTGGFIALQAVPLLALALAAAVRRRRDAPPGPSQHYRRVRAALAAARRRTDTGQLVEVERIVLDAAVTLGDADIADPVSSLRRRGRAGAAYALAGLLREIHRLRFAPDAPRDATGEVHRRATAFVDMLAPRRFWQRRGGAAGVVLASILLGASAGEAAGGTSVSRFDAAVAAYEAGDHAAAANAFHAYAQANPRDPNGWYNLGLAAYAAGDPGRAAWAWLRASRLSPRDADLRHNLQRVDAQPALRLARPPDLLAPGERAVAAAAAWWLAVLAFGLRRRRRRAAFWTAATAVIVAGLLAGAAVLDGTRGPAVTPLGTGAPLFAGPSIHDDAVGSLQVGSLSEVVERRGDWLRVRAASRSEGWVERRAVAAP